MPTLTVDLPEAVYRAAITFAPAKRERVVSDAILAAVRADFETRFPSASVPPKTLNPETAARLRAQAAAAIADAALREQWANEVTDLEAERETFEEFMRNVNANRAATGERLIY